MRWFGLFFIIIFSATSHSNELSKLNQLANELADIKITYQQIEQKLAQLGNQQHQIGIAAAIELKQLKHNQQSLLRLQRQPTSAILTASLFHNTPPRPNLQRWLLEQHQQQLLNHQNAALHPLREWQQLVEQQRQLEQRAGQVSTQLQEIQRIALRRARKLERDNPTQAANLRQKLTNINPTNPLPSTDPCPASSSSIALPISATIYQTYCPAAQPPRYGLTLHTLPLAQLYSPTAGEITFSGKHGRKNASGWVLILNTPTGQQHIFAGLLSSPLSRGQKVEFNQPLGRTPPTNPLLYWEHRNSKGQPYNPL